MSMKKIATKITQALPDDSASTPIPLVQPPQENFDPVTGAPTGGIGTKERELFQRQDELQLSEIRKDLAWG